MKGLSVRYGVADPGHLRELVDFLHGPVIDEQFVLPLSRRSKNIEERVNWYAAKGFWLIADENRRIVGCRACMFDALTGVSGSSTLVVHPDRQRLGIGRQIMRRSLDIALERFAPRVLRLDSWSTNVIMPGLALEFGYVKVGEFEDPERRPPGVLTVTYERPGR